MEKIMSPELDEGLVAKYPKIFNNRYSDMRVTAMCWGFSHGDGWYNIIDMMCSNIQNHIDHTRKERSRALRYNRALSRSTKDNVEPLVKYFSHGREVNDWHIKMSHEDFDDIEPQCKIVPPACPQVVASQVKEKFGTLRFYYSGGDDYVSGVIRFAESMSCVTCEVCGAPGETSGRSWIRTLCETHRKD
jgi:hypothetical protein